MDTPEPDVLAAYRDPWVGQDQSPSLGVHQVITEVGIKAASGWCAPSETEFHVDPQ